VDDAPAAGDDIAAASAEPPIKPPKKAGRSPRTDRLERQGKLHAQLTPHEPPGGRGKGNGKKNFKKGSEGRGKQGGERGKRQKKDGKASDRHKPLEIFD